MNCYQHHSNSAIGVCKSCGKGLCANCTTDLGFAVTCQGECEEFAKTSQQLINNTKTTFSAQKRYKLILPVFFCILGGFFIIAQLLDGSNSNGTFFIGGIFVLFGLVSLIINITYFKKIKS